MLRVVTIIFFVAYIALLIGIGFAQARKIKDMESYWMADRSLSSWRIAFCLAASWFGLSSFTGQAGWLYAQGMGSLLYLAVPNFVAILLVGFVFSRRVRKVPAISQAEMLEMRYSSSVRPWLALIILIAFAGYSAMEFIAMNYVFEVFFKWPGWIGGVVIIVVTMVYVNIGGMNTVVLTEVIQYCLLASVGVIVGVASWIKASAMIKAGEVAEIAATASLTSIPHLVGSNASWWNFLGFGIGTTLILLLSYLPSWSTEQSPWQRVWMAKDGNTAYKGAILGSALNCVVYIFTIMMAVAAFVVLGAPEAHPDYNVELLVYDLMVKVLPSWIFPLILVGFMAAAMSNISNFSTSSATNLVKDFYQRYLRPQASQREMVWASRICIAITLALGGIIGFIMPSILDAVYAAASLATCGYFVPICGALYWRRGNTAGCIASFILGAGSYMTMYLLDKAGIWTCPIDFVIVGLLISLVSYVGVSLCTKKPEMHQLVAFFSEDAKAFISDWKVAGFTSGPKDATLAEVKSQCETLVQSERTLVRYTCVLNGVDFEGESTWKNYIDQLLKNKSWCWMSGYDIIYKITNEDMLSNIRLARGYSDNDVLLYCEPLNEEADEAIRMMALAVDDIKAIL